MNAEQKCESTLQSVSLTGHELTAPLLEKITSEPLKSNLVSISLVGCRVTLDAAKELLECPSLRHLNLNGNAELDDELFVPAHVSGVRRGHVYTTRSHATQVEVNSTSSAPSRSNRSKRKRSACLPAQRYHSELSEQKNTHFGASIPYRKQDFENAFDINTTSALEHFSAIMETPIPIDFNNDLVVSEWSEFEPTSKRAKAKGCANKQNSFSPQQKFDFDLSSRSHGLLSLHLSGSNITNKTLEAMAKLYPNLTELDVSHCSKVSDLTPIILRCRSLRSLNISGCPVQSHSDKLLPYIVKSDLEDAHSEATEEEQIQLPFLENLENLLFSGSGRLDVGFALWMRACGSTLLELRIANKTLPEDPIGQHIHARNARAQLSAGLSLSEDQVLHLPLFVRMLMQCERLEALDMHGVNVTTGAMKMLFDVAKPAWTKTCAEFDVVNCDEVCLETLSVVFGLPQQEDNGFSSAHERGSEATWPSLKTLRISGGKHVATLSGPVLPAIGTYACPQLENLVLNNPRAGRPLLRPVHIAQILQKFASLKSIEMWCCSSVSYSLAALIPHICPQVTNVLLCIVGGQAGGAGGQQQMFAEHHLPARLQHAHQNGRPIEPNAAAAVLAAAESMAMPALLSSEQVRTLQKMHPTIEWKFWRHSVESPRQFLHIRPIDSATGDTVASLRPDQPANQLTVVVEPTGETDAALPLRSRLIRASVLVDGVPIWNCEKGASMHHLTQSIWGLVTHNAGAIPLVEDWCCACNIEEFNGVLFYDDAEHVYWDVLEPGAQGQYKFHKAQYVSAIAAAMQQQWHVFKRILPKEELIQQALLFTQQHAWHQKLLDRSSSSSSSTASSSPSSPEDANKHNIINASTIVNSELRDSQLVRMESN